MKCELTDTHCFFVTNRSGVVVDRLVVALYCVQIRNFTWIDFVCVSGFVCVSVCVCVCVCV